jgi:hypothetical protein
LAPLLAHLGRRLRLRDGWLAAQRTLGVACGGALLVQIAGRLWPIAELWRWTLLPFALWLLILGGYLLSRRPSPMLVARRVDLELGLKERLSTAVGLEAWRDDSLGLAGRSSSPPAFPPGLVVRQRQDALAVAQSIEPQRAFPLRWRWRPLALAGALIAAALLLALLPNPMDAVIAERVEVAEAVREQAERIEELREEIAEAEMPEDRREELLRQLAELADRLRANPGDRESALADFSRLEEALQRQVDPQADAKQAALDALAQQLESLAGQESGEPADAGTPDPGTPDPDAMEESLEALADLIAQAGEAERQALAQRLGQTAARAAQAGNTSLAQALSDLARAAQAGDAEAASQAARGAAEAMRQAQGELSAQAALRQSLSQLGASRQAIAGAGAASGQGQQEGQGQQAGQGQGGQGGQGQSGQGGQGQGGQGQSGGGTKADQLPPGTGQGQAGRPQGEARPGGEDTLDQQVFVPWERRPGSGEEVTLPGQDSGQGESEVRERENPLPGTSDEALVPYYEVFYEYLDAANQAMERTYVPSGLQEYVREYFSRLEPE